MLNRDTATAAFINPRNGKEVWIMPSTIDKIGFIYGENRHATDASRIGLDMLQDMQCVKSPIGDLYHVWHICTCDKCSHPAIDALVPGKRLGGRVWNHSQGSFDSHLRFVDADKVLTFNTPKGS